jgi:muramoyltetrapeptide carboxypeptidase LdcA involved in peptidoglycan recycling
LARLRDVFDLKPVEYPTTRVVAAPAKSRAQDINDAFADTTIKAVLATIGGDDQISVIPFLDNHTLQANPKPFFGYSDNTNLLHHLFRLGLVGYHGGSIMVHLGRSGQLHPAHEQSLRAALFTDGWCELVPPAEWGDEPGDWADTAASGVPPTMWPSQGWHWYGPEQVIEGPGWGGNLEIVSWLLQAGRVGRNEQYAGCVLYLETSEEMPSATDVYRILRNMGERGLLQQFPAVLVGRAKAWERHHPNPPEAKLAYTQAQRDAFRSALTQYHPHATVVFDLDIGHTDPQLILPYGGMIRVDSAARKITVRY